MDQITNLYRFACLRNAHRLDGHATSLFRKRGLKVAAGLLMAEGLSAKNFNLRDPETAAPVSRHPVTGAAASSPRKQASKRRKTMKFNESISERIMV